MTLELPMSKAGTIINESTSFSGYVAPATPNNYATPPPSSPVLRNQQGTQSQTLFASPSKMDATRYPMNDMTTFAGKKPDNIGYPKMIEETNELAGLASQTSNEHRHVVYSMMVGMNKILESGEHNQERYKGSALEVFVK